MATERITLDALGNREDNLFSLSVFTGKIPEDVRAGFHSQEEKLGWVKLSERVDCE